MELHQWIFPLDVWRRQQGEDGGEVNASTPRVEEAQANVGATGAGPQYVRGGPGTWPEDRRGTAGGATTLPTTHPASRSLTLPPRPPTRRGGPTPPPPPPVFVPPHHPREPLEMEGGTTFFVTDGIESALEQAKQAADGRTCCSAGRQRRPAVPPRRTGRRVRAAHRAGPAR